MKLGISYFQKGPLARPEYLVRFAQRAEALGFDSLAMGDHIVVPLDPPDSYPYSQAGDFPVAGSKPYFEPVITMGYLAGVTQRIRLGFSVLVLPYRNPLLLAKMLSTLDVLCGGRLFLGVGSGWWEDEFRALGIGAWFRQRGAVTDEFLAILRNLWNEEQPVFEGQFHRYGNLDFSPKPAQPGGIPIWVGGNTLRGMRRAVAWGDAWHPLALRPPGSLSPPDLARRRTVLESECEKAGRDPATLPITLRCPLNLAGKREQTLSGSTEEILADLHAYADAGVAHLTVELLSPSFEEVMEGLERIGAEILPRLP